MQQNNFCRKSRNNFSYRNELKRLKPGVVLSNWKQIFEVGNVRKLELKPFISQYTRALALLKPSIKLIFLMKCLKADNTKPNLTLSVVSGGLNFSDCEHQ